MSKIIILGGAGGIGQVATKTVLASNKFDEVVIADLNIDELKRLEKELDNPTIRPMEINANESLTEVIKDFDLVVNCIGPFYKYGPKILKEAIEAKVTYVDVCDDLDATERQLKLSDLAKENEVCAVIGLGNSPGLANLLAKYAADYLFDEIEVVDIMHIHGGESFEGHAVIKHRIHAMVNDVPVFDNGEFLSVRLLEESGSKYVEDCEFRDVGVYPVYPYPHPETITLPKVFPSLRRVTNRGVVFPLEYFQFTMETVRKGLSQASDLTDLDADIETWTNEILSSRSSFLESNRISSPKGCLKVVTKGQKNSKNYEYIFSVSSTSEGAGAGTGIPAGIGAIILNQKEFRKFGVFPPEAIIDPVQALSIASDIIPKMNVSVGNSKGTMPVNIVEIDPDGNVTEIEI